jgi:hypothetical protein
MIEFPFQRGRPYSLGELRAFESDLLAARRRDKGLGDLLRDPSGPTAWWMRLRNKELAPLRVFADHIGAPDDDQFLINPDGGPVDAQIIAERRTLNLQFTLAVPQWDESGYQHHKVMKALNAAQCVVGHPPFALDDGVAMGAIVAITNEDRDRACRRGLEAAIANKALQDGRAIKLAVFAQEFFLQLLDVQLLGTIVDNVLGSKSLSFDSICVFDSQPGFFVERRMQAA